MPTVISIHLNGDGVAKDLAEREGSAGKCYHLSDDAPPIRVAVLEGGMASGRPLIGIIVDLQGDGWVLAETSVSLFLAAADAIRAKYGSGHGN